MTWVGLDGQTRSVWIRKNKRTLNLLGSGKVFVCPMGRPPVSGSSYPQGLLYLLKPWDNAGTKTAANTNTETNSISVLSCGLENIIKWPAALCNYRLYTAMLWLLFHLDQCAFWPNRPMHRASVPRWPQRSDQSSREIANRIIMT